MFTLEKLFRGNTEYQSRQGEHESNRETENHLSKLEHTWHGDVAEDKMNIGKYIGN